MVSRPIIAGDSHTVCLGVPLFTEDGIPRLVNLTNNDGRFQGITGVLRRDDRYWDLLTRAGAGKEVVILWQGNQHLASFLFAPSRLFDFHTAARPGLARIPDSDLIPETAVREFYAASLTGLGEVIRKLKATRCMPVLCGTPPPKGNDDLLRHLLAKETHFIRLSAQMGIGLGEVALSPPLLRLKLWLALQQAMQDFAIRNDLPFVGVPPAVQTPEGYLRKKFWAPDATHANEAYGRVMLDHLHANCSF